MERTTFFFKIGSFDCWVISDGIITIPGGGFLPLACLLVRTGEHTILIDTGRGVGNEPDAGKFVANLRAASIKLVEIDIILFTHAHYDHVSGIVDSQGKSIFPNARYVIHKGEWKYWLPRLETLPAPEDGIHEICGRINILPVKDLFSAVSDKTDIVPGIKYVLVPGHTRGNSMVEISSGSSKLLCIGDVMHDLTELIQPDILAKFDLNPEQASRNRIKVMSQIAAAKVMVFGGHFPFPGIGYIVKQAGVLTWKPV